MTLLEQIRYEMANRGATPQQMNAKWIPMVVEIVTQNKGYEDEAKLEADLKFLRHEIEHLETIKRNWREKVDHDRDELEKMKVGIENYIKEWSQAFSECETEEGRDRLRTAQVFANSVQISTKYDNTAYIVGLSAILSGGVIAPIEEIKKINTKLEIPDMWKVRKI